MDIQAFWDAVLRQDADAMRAFFLPAAHICWHATRECFTVEEYLRANCEYPGHWDGRIERVERMGALIITATHVFATDAPLSFHVVSFFRTEGEKIAALDEYWGDDGPAPAWRQALNLGTRLE